MKNKVCEGETPKQRFICLDALRGFAVLGILLMNINGFGMHIGAYDNPNITGGTNGWNLWIWWGTFIVIEGKLRALFAMMFGASVVLLTSSMEQKGMDASESFFRRNLWLLFLGACHAYLLWMGDVLFFYALCSFSLYPFRKLEARKLFAIAMAILAINTAYEFKKGWEKHKLYQTAEKIEAAKKNRRAITKEQIYVMKEVDSIREDMIPDRATLEEDAAAWRSGFTEILAFRAAKVYEHHSAPYYTYDVWAAMFLGMALLKWGVLSGQRSRKFYLKLMAIGYVIGLPLARWMAEAKLESAFDPLACAFHPALYELQRMLLAMGHISALMLLANSNLAKRLVEGLAATGRMALSNYIMQSLVCSTLFYGYGFGLYGTLERFELGLIALSICLFQLAFSTLWFKYCNYGPLEWAWRSLTYWKRPVLLKKRLQPMPELEEMPQATNQM